MLSLLAISVLLAAVFPRPVFGSTGQPNLGVTDTDSVQPSTFTSGVAYVNVTAGSDRATTDGSVTGFFAINFGTFGGLQLMTFSGAQFRLYISQNGLSQISPGDIEYAGPNLFKVADLTTNAGWHAVTETNGTFYVGQTTGGQEVLVGPLPMGVANDYKYIKVFDGSASAVAVSAQYFSFEPNLALTPTVGAAGTKVSVTGSGFPSNIKIDLTYSYVFSPWNAAPKSLNGNWTVGIDTGNGVFTSTSPIIDTKQAYNPNGGLVPESLIEITARYEHSPHTPLVSAGFEEKTRVFTGVRSSAPGGGPLDSTNLPPGPYGNDTSTADSNLVQPVSVKVQGGLNIAGNYMAANSTVDILIGTMSVGSSMTNGTGYFNATVTVPALPEGIATAKVVNNGVAYEFGIYVVSNLVVTPTSGPVGTRVVVTVSGFPTNTRWFLYWYEHSKGDHTWYQIANGTTDSTGSFNMTVTFTIPESYGGNHLVSASTINVPTSSPNPPLSIALATMTVTASVTTTTTTTTYMTTSSSITSTASVSTSTSTTTSTGMTSITSSTASTPQTSTTSASSLTEITSTATTRTSVATGPDYTSYVVFGVIALVTVVVIVVWVAKGRRT